MTDRIPLYQQMHTQEGTSHDAWVALYEHVGVDVGDVARNATPAGPRSTRQAPHEYDECAKGPSRCPVHRRQYRQDLEQRRAGQRAQLAEQERRAGEQRHRVAAMNVFRIEQMATARRRSA